MKSDEVLILLLAGAAAWFIVKYARPGVALAAAPGGGQEIGTDVLPGQPGYGWRYFTGGVAIDPLGSYYYNGDLVWSP